METFLSWVNQAVAAVFEWAPKLVGALIVLAIGWWAINAITRITKNAMQRSKLDRDVIPFLSSIVNVGLKVLLFISVAGMIGIETTSFIALLGMAGLAIGLALQGTLGHFASGVMVLLFKPYRVGDLVDIHGNVGSVEEIQVFHTIIRTLDNKRVIIPNGTATSDIMTNLSTHKYLRVDLEAAMPYEEDFDKIQQIIKSALASTTGVLKDPAPTVEILGFGENNVKLAIRPYAMVDEYWNVYFNSYKNVKAALGANHVQVAYPRRNISVLRGNSSSSTTVAAKPGAARKNNDDKGAASASGSSSIH
ncbi:mechanosensitive ion channel family protein [Pontibacter sp. G13]|uniref:mechanosensitive ion channel family protein n=1 Tax=Pontibacter sp. G13 TaxID=3074898 RepID=UPI00288BEEED|nr:mechanosensitive ion channel family protein [Pontibacter sp. G13]WNJ19285.1 mechanosensitive ion channel family protein [Pontibacter sp. G13]